MLKISTRLIAEAARARGWHVEPLDERFISTLAVTPPGGQTYYFDSCQPPFNSAAAIIIADNKLATYLIAQRTGVPVAAFCMHDPKQPGESLAFLQQQAKQGHQLVVKPVDTNHGDGITIGVQTKAQLQEALNYAAQFSDRILLQRRHYGVDYRITVVDNKVVAAAMRRPASVVGDGERTTRQLIEQKNQEPARGVGHHVALSKIDVTAAERFLRERMTDIPARGEYLPVMATANLSKGGDAEDVTETLHPTFAQAALNLARSLNMFLCGVDFLATDHTQPLTAHNGILLEINATPGLRMHHFPSVGQSRAVADAILDGIITKKPSLND